ncbi:unnamed protein product [Meganyctiphanes norvegica]|uniref:CUB domain-containing protein n=1 Tax=Meganyctiphanes norvegica TaxID=48144 RepID=A0AAV2QQ73_MEGNR
MDLNTVMVLLTALVLLVAGDRASSLILSPSGSCGGDYNGTSGSIESPNYPGNYPADQDCYWSVTANEYSAITVSFEHFDIDSYNNDYLEIRDGIDSGAPLITRISGSYGDNPDIEEIISTGNSLYVYFHSDYDYQYSGFKLNWITESCVEYIEGTDGELFSLNYPDDYPENVRCWWILNSPDYSVIRVVFEMFSTPDSYDYLEIRDGNESSAPVLVTLSGHLNSIDDIKSTSNSLSLFLYSNNVVQDIGFKLNWFAGSPSCYDCDNYPGTSIYDPTCGEDVYHGRTTPDYVTCYTSIHYDGTNRVERGGTYNDEEDGECFNSGFALSCFCRTYHCNNNLCQHCTNTTTSPTTTTPLYETTTQWWETTTQPPITTATTPWQETTPHSATTNRPPTSVYGLQCFSCFGCNIVDEDTTIETSEDFLSCSTAIALGNDNFVIRGGSLDLYEDGACRHEADGVYVCYCTSNRCNSEAAVDLMSE